QNVAVNQVVGGIAHERVAAIRLGKAISGIDDRAARRGGVAARDELCGWKALYVGPFTPARRTLDAPSFERTNAVEFARRAVIGNVECDGVYREEWVAPEIMIRQNDVPQVLAVG